MAKTLPLPPEGFNDLTTDEKLHYVEQLWDIVAADAAKTPVPDWHRDVVKERLAENQASDREGKTWSELRRSLLRE